MAPIFGYLASDGQAGSYRFVRRISIDKRACIERSGQLPGGRLLGSWPEWGSRRRVLQDLVSVLGSLGLANLGGIRPGQSFRIFRI